MSCFELGCDSQPSQRIEENTTEKTGIRTDTEEKQLVSNHILHSTAVSHPYWQP